MASEPRDLPYPNSTLKKPVRPYGSTFSAVGVVKSILTAPRQDGPCSQAEGERVMPTTSRVFVTCQSSDLGATEFQVGRRPMWLRPETEEDRLEPNGEAFSRVGDYTYRLSRGWDDSLRAELVYDHGHESLPPARVWR
jgi:hypothetical protein